jgi:hypothetical protein
MPKSISINLGASYWGRTGSLRVYLASKHDPQFGYVTANIQEMVRTGLLPADHGLVQGDYIAVCIEGVIVPFKCNRATGDTVAAHWPRALTMPVWREQGGGSTSMQFDALVVGRLGLRMEPTARRSQARSTGGRISQPTSSAYRVA